MEVLRETPMVVSFQMAGQIFMGLNGGSVFRPNPSVSFYVTCETEEEVQTAWEIFSAEGAVLMPLDTYPWSEKYGWIQDKYGVSWQIALGNISDTNQKYCPLLMFTGKNAGRAEEALNYYVSVFEHSSVTGILRYGAHAEAPEGFVQHAQCKLGNYTFMVMDSAISHDFDFNEGISFVVECDTQEEIDYYWDTLTAEGMESNCGWLKDKFGVSWQIIPRVLSQLMSNPDKAENVMQAFLRMKKFDIQKLMEA